jgi:hypothetical protein
VAAASRSRLHATHRQRQQQTQATVGAMLARLVRALPDLSDDAAELYVARAVPVIVAGQRNAAALAAGYVRAAAPTLRRDRPPDLSLGALAVTAETPWVASPIIRGRAKLAQGLAWAEALDAAGAYAGELASGDLQRAMRFGLDAGADAVGARVRWRKELSGGACPWCVTVAAGSYTSADSVPFHEHDRCSVAPEFDEEG